STFEDTDFDSSVSESKASEEKPVEVPNREGLPPKPPPPPPVPGSIVANERLMEEELQEQEGKQRGSSPVLIPHVSRMASAALRHSHEDQGGAKVSSDSKRHVPLQDRLALKEKQLETKLLDSQLQEAELEARSSERAAVLVEEIYKAQRERDQAVMARLRLANEERDEALLRAKKLQEATLEYVLLKPLPKQSLGSVCLTACCSRLLEYMMENIKAEESDLDLEELLNRVNSAESALAIEQSGEAIIEQIQRARERRSQITSEEMKAVIDERDAAVTRVQTSATCTKGQS
ncbi:hypothetical protein DNTS_022620, partial [Danionella cerebrum]